MSKNYIIDQDFLKENYALNSKGADKLAKINVSIRKAQQRLKSYLCDDLYNELLTEFESDSLSYANNSLLPYCKNLVGAIAYNFYIVLSQVTDTDAGFRTFLDDNSDAAEKNQLKDLKEGIGENDIKFFESELVNFLVNNLDDYPLYKNSNCYKCERKSSSLSGISSSGYRPYNYGHEKNITIDKFRID